MRKSLCLLVFLTLVTFRAEAQNAASNAENEVKAVIQQLFDGMRRGDSAAVRAVFYPGSRLQTTTADKTGKPVLSTGSIDAFVKAVGTPHPDVWDERLTGIEIRVDDNLATAWTPYEFYAGSKFSHRGVNAFQLFRSEAGWKIIAITDTRRK
ncbi:MAG: nuclear transport factor 2 family protein [Cytophagales bacterium]|jgi:hypothetical protein|nr:nuclear transport factor 2 family protein [Cytophagales bacterium]